ncbi:SAF domain-containing protein [Plantibacter flavus]|uniref:hypothetical protein n=1 Tax=Plantibacter flavus TaxID=150123 RepID=UPI003F18F9C7
MRGIERSAGPGGAVRGRAGGADGRSDTEGGDRLAMRGRQRGWTSAGSRFWVDPRFVVGLALVVASIVGVWWLVTASSRTVPVYAATRTLTPGATLEPSMLRVVDIRLGGSDAAYLSAAKPSFGDQVVTRTVGSGELVPLSALGDAAELGITTLVVEPGRRPATDVVPGTLVDLWAAAPVDEGYGSPEVIVPAATIVRSSEEEGFLSGGGSAALELAVPRSAVATVLAAQAAGHLLSVVPTEPGAR